MLDMNKFLKLPDHLVEEEGLTSPFVHYSHLDEAIAFEKNAELKVATHVNVVYYTHTLHPTQIQEETATYTERKCCGGPSFYLQHKQHSKTRTLTQVHYRLHNTQIGKYGGRSP